MKFSELHFKNTILSLACCVFAMTSNYAQSDAPAAKPEFWKHVKFGGGLGIGTGNGFFSATLAPSAIYQFNSAFALGVGLNGTYNSRKNQYKSTILGGSVLALYNPLREIQMSAEFEELNVSRKYASTLNIENDNYWYPALFVGAGYRANHFTVGIRYDVLYNTNKSVYPQAWMPFVRVYF